MEWFERIFDFLIHRPIIMMALMSLPLFLAWYLKQCFPSQKLLLLTLTPLGFSIGIVFWPTFIYFAAASALVVALLAIVDICTLISAKYFRATREVMKIASLGKKHDCQFTVANHSNQSCKVEIRDDLSGEFSTDVHRFEFQFAGRSRSSFEYKFVASERGRFQMERIYIKVFSRFNLWHAYYEIDVHDEIFVYPNLKQIAEYDLLARTNRLNQMGVRRTRKIGQDNEFERLRDYTRGDNYKHMDWRATARRRQLTVKDFQENQSQRIVFLIDCGRMMTGQSGGIDLFDHALNAILMLSYVALRQGDSVGLICFSNQIHSYTPAKSGVNHINRLLQATFDQRANFVESRYDEAFLYLRKNCLKRSLVVLVTNVIDTLNSDQIHRYMSNLTQRHLPLSVLLRDHQMFDAIDGHLERPAPRDSDRFFSAAAAANILNWRQQVITELLHQNIMALDVFPEEMTAGLINQYLEIKAKHLL